MCSDSKVRLLSMGIPSKTALSWSKTWEPKSKTLEGGEMGMAVGKIEKLYVFTLQRAVTKWKNQMLTARQKKLSPFIG